MEDLHKLSRRLRGLARRRPDLAGLIGNINGNIPLYLSGKAPPALRGLILDLIDELVRELGKPPPDNVVQLKRRKRTVRE